MVVDLRPMVRQDSHTPARCQGAVSLEYPDRWFQSATPNRAEFLRVGEGALHEKLSPLCCFLLLMDGNILPRVGRAWQPIRRVVHCGPLCINRLVPSHFCGDAVEPESYHHLMGSLSLPRSSQSSRYMLINTQTLFIRYPFSGVKTPYIMMSQNVKKLRSGDLGTS
ncbi:hypothetical protein AVEN_216761-1 [Araneus ventricosus]|uniref:Uncharacterized protein n=1 Tax=Araneus ventricosus TaxID=182803 RepID=A0A4Y2QA89_ARAVE|nr:hypothetical protein AVEN_216761-1 [Araneus ventricosus]